MTNTEIENQLLNLIKNERALTREILNLINLADRRKLFLERGFSSLFDWLTKHYGYSEGAAQRRIQAARLLNALPEVAEKISGGEVNLTTLAKTQSAIRQHEKTTGEKLSTREKTAIVSKIENRSTAAAEKELSLLFPNQIPKTEKQTRLDENQTRIAVTITNETLENLQRVQEILSHTIPNTNLADIIAYMTKDFLKRREPVKKTAAAAKRRVNSRTSLFVNRKNIFQRAQGKCEFVDLKTGRRCKSRYQIEVDHIYPKALGGGNELENLRCLCRSHNQYVARNVLGERAMNYKR